MKIKNGARICSIFFSLMLIFSMVMPTNVFAATISYNDRNISVENLLKSMGGDDVKKTSGNVTFEASSGKGLLKVKTKGEERTILTLTPGVSGAPSSIDIDISAFKASKQSDVTKAMKMFTDGLSNINGVNADTVQQIMSDIQDVDSSVASVMLPLIFEGTKGDMFQAYKITSPFLNVFSVILGVGAVILIIILFGSTVMDLAYIGLPVWREAQANKEGANGKHPFGVSYEALRTVTEIEQGFGNSGGGEYKNAYLLYFKRRALTYIILAICIMYLICGGLSGIIGWVLSLVSGITG